MLRLVAIAAILSGPAVYAGAQPVAPDAAKVAAGKSAFAANCALCHSAEPGDGAGNMGPKLHSLFGRAAGTADQSFPYTAELQGSKLIWDAATLDRFLADPGAVVPGTAMAVSVPAKADRDAIVAYFDSLKTPESRP